MPTTSTSYREKLRNFLAQEMELPTLEEWEQEKADLIQTCTQVILFEFRACPSPDAALRQLEELSKELMYCFLTALFVGGDSMLQRQALEKLAARYPEEAGGIKALLIGMKYRKQKAA